jgi:hypothetical protein
MILADGFVAASLSYELLLDGKKAEGLNWQNKFSMAYVESSWFQTTVGCSVVVVVLWLRVVLTYIYVITCTFVQPQKWKETAFY